MATSGSTNYNLTRDNIITLAFQTLGVYGAGESPSSADTSFANDMFNMMVKAFQGQGAHLWKHTEAGIYFTADTAKYSLPGVSGGDDPAETALASAAAAAATSLTVDSTTGMAVSDVILIELDAGTLQSTTISTIPSSTTLTIASGLTSVAAIDNKIYTYTTAIGRPLRISSARLRNSSDDDRELTALSRSEYFSLTNKDSAGSPTSYYYDPQLTTASLYVWPVPDTVDQRLEITYSKSLEDFDAAGDNPDFPQEWLLALMWNLASLLAPAYGKDAKARAIIIPRAEAELQKVLGYDKELGEIVFSYSQY